MMDVIMDSCEEAESSPVHGDDDTRRPLSPPAAAIASMPQANNDLLALRCQNLSLQAQVQILTRQLQSCCSVQQQNKQQQQAPHPSFPFFPRLPPELRRKIWHHALPNSRIISIDFQVPPPPRFPRCPRPEFIPNHPAPAFLLVCREARQVALEHYQLAFRASSSRCRTIAPAGSSSGGSAGFYFDFCADALCFPRETTPLRLVLFLEDMPAAEVRRVRHLAVGSELPKDVMKYITQFRGLEVFSLILADPRVVAPRGRFALVEAAHRSIWVMGAYWNHELTSWGRMEALIQEGFEEARLMGEGECRVPRVEFVYAVSTEEGCCGDCPGHE